MTPGSTTPAKRYAILAAVLATGALLALLAGCGGDEESTPPLVDIQPVTTTFVGAFTNGTENGKVTIVIHAVTLARRFQAARSLGPWRAGATNAAAAATLKFAGGATRILTGSYDTVTDSLDVTDGTYRFHGEYDDTNPPPSMLGQYTGPNGAGGFGALNGGSVTPEIYLGSFQSDSTNVTGVFDLARCDTLARAIACPAGEDPAYLDGNALGAGTIKAITLSGGVPGSFDVTATGSLDTGAHTVSGAWHMYDYGMLKGDDGTWSGALSP